MLLKVPSSVEELQKSLRRYHIALMASSPPGQLIQKYFFYAQQVNRINFIIMTWWSCSLAREVHKYFEQWKGTVQVFKKGRGLLCKTSRVTEGWATSFLYTTLNVLPTHVFSYHSSFTVSKEAESKSCLLSGEQGWPLTGNKKFGLYCRQDDVVSPIYNT